MSYVRRMGAVGRNLTGSPPPKHCNAGLALPAPPSPPQNVHHFDGHESDLANLFDEHNCDLYHHFASHESDFWM